LLYLLILRSEKIECLTGQGLGFGHTPHLAFLLNELLALCGSIRSNLQKLPYMLHSFSYPWGCVECQCHASLIIFSIDVRDGFHPKISCALSELATSVAGSPGRRGPILDGILFSVTFLAASIISLTENPWLLPKLKILLSPPFCRYSSANKCASIKSSTCT